MFFSLRLVLVHMGTGAGALPIGALGGRTPPPPEGRRWRFAARMYVRAGVPIRHGCKHDRAEYTFM
jgi:hypothetical protein